MTNRSKSRGVCYPGSIRSNPFDLGNRLAEISPGIKQFVILAFVVTTVFGCASDTSYRTTNRPVVEERSVIYQQGSDIDPGEDAAQPKVIVTAELEEPVKKSKIKKSVPASREAVLGLLKQSENALRSQRYQEAENLLSRALRIEPSNAWLWHNMAVVKFYQEDYHQAIQQAFKSNNLEKNSARLTNDNWKLIAQSYELLGDKEQASKAKMKIIH